MQMIEKEIKRKKKKKKTSPVVKVVVLLMVLACTTTLTTRIPIFSFEEKRTSTSLYAFASSVPSTKVGEERRQERRPEEDVEEEDDDEEEIVRSNGWMRWMDDRSGKFYFQEESTGKTQWEEPEGWNLGKEKQDDVEDEVKEDTGQTLDKLEEQEERREREEMDAERQRQKQEEEEEEAERQQQIKVQNQRQQEEMQRQQQQQAAEAAARAAAETEQQQQQQQQQEEMQRQQQQQAAEAAARAAAETEQQQQQQQHASPPTRSPAAEVNGNDISIQEIKMQHHKQLSTQKEKHRDQIAVLQKQHEEEIGKHISDLEISQKERDEASTKMSEVQEKHDILLEQHEKLKVESKKMEKRIDDTLAAHAKELERVKNERDAIVDEKTKIEEDLKVSYKEQSAKEMKQSEELKKLREELMEIRSLSKESKEARERNEEALKDSNEEIERISRLYEEAKANASEAEKQKQSFDRQLEVLKVEYEEKMRKLEELSTFEATTTGSSDDKGDEKGIIVEEGTSSDDATEDDDARGIYGDDEDEGKDGDDSGDDAREIKPPPSSETLDAKIEHDDVYKEDKIKAGNADGGDGGDDGDEYARKEEEFEARENEIGEEEKDGEDNDENKANESNNASFADSLLATKDRIVVALKPLEPYIGKFINILSVALSEAASKAWESKEGVKLSKILGQCEEKLKEFLERYVDKIFKTSFARDEVVVRRSVRVIVFAPPFLTTIFFMRFFSTFLGLNDSSSKKTTVAMNKFSGDASGIQDQMGTAPSPQQSIGGGGDIGGGGGGIQQHQYQKNQSSSSMLINPMLPPNAGVGGSRNNDIPAQSVPFIPGSTTNDSGMDAGNQMGRKNSGDNTARDGSNMSGGGINRDLSNNSLTGRPGSGEHPPPTMMGDLATAGVSTGDNDNAYKVPPKFGVPHGDITRTVITPTASMTGAVSANANLFVPSPATSPRATTMGDGNSGGDTVSASIVPIVQNPSIPQLDRALTLTSPMQEQRLTNADGDVDAEIEGGENVPPPPVIPGGVIKKKQTKPPAWAKNARATQVGAISSSTENPRQTSSSSPPSPLPSRHGYREQHHQQQQPVSAMTPQQSTSAQTTYAPHGGSSRSRPPPGVPILRKSVSTGSKPNPNFRGPPPGVKVLSRPPPGNSREPPP